MTEIPGRLKQKGIKFVLIEKGGKRPFQIEWQNKIIEYDNLELQSHLNSGGNYGVMGGGEKMLIIIDFDNEKVQNEVCKKLPPTFTVKTGSGKLHKYFSSDKCESFKIFNDNLDTIADIQGEGKQVVGPGSVHPNGNRYEVLEDNEIAFLSYSEIRALLMPYDKKERKVKKEYERPKGIITDNFLDKLKNNISVEDVLNSFGIDTSKNPTECPFHSSKGGKCLGFNYETAHCFHCDGSWNIFSLVKDIKKCDFKEALQYLANISGMEEELEKSKREFLDTIKESEEYKKKDIKRRFLELTTGKEKSWPIATELLVNYVKEKNYFYTTKEDMKSETWVYKDGIYIPQGKSEVKEILRDLLKEFYSQFVYGLVMAKLEADTFIDAQTFFSNNYINEVPVKNGILNIFTRELKPFTHEKIFFNKLPVTFNPAAQCPKITKFLEDVLPGEEDKDIIYELGGFCLYNEYSFEVAFMFYGYGRNAKDKTIELFKRTLGIENCAAIPLASLEPNNFVISELFGKKANLAGDISNQDLKDTSMFKACTGRSIISAKRKFLNNITFVNYAKFIFACNELPLVYDNSRGFWDRWILIEFPYTFVSKEEYEAAKDKTKLKIRDTDIISKITTEEELSGLLNKFLEGLSRLMMNKRFSSTKSTAETKNFWIRKSNSFTAFCLDEIEESPNGRVLKKDLRKRYADYCKKHLLSTKSEVVIKKVLQENYGAGEMQSSDLERYWEGVKWKNQLV
jgi:P4 family phage/plasmid primase-like protien